MSRLVTALTNSARLILARCAWLCLPWLGVSPPCACLFVLAWSWLILVLCAWLCLTRLGGPPMARAWLFVLAWNWLFATF